MHASQPFFRSPSGVLPQSVKAKVHILGADYYETLKRDLGEETYSPHSLTHSLTHLL